MKYQNPVVRGFYPDPSVCYANGHFYLVCSSFQYFPGVPLFESDDLVNWKQIGHVLTRHSQVMLDKVRSSGGVFAPTIRFHEGRFYMVTNNNSTNENFYVYTDDIFGEWSDPVTVDQDGIDPSLLFDDGHVYFLSNGSDDEGRHGIVQCEIEAATGRKLSPSRCLWTGSGGRYIESPHMYHIGGYYYLMVAEGGTEYGHMVTYARSESVWGPFTDYALNPVLTNRNKAPGILQGIGHGDLIQKEDGSWYIVTLGFRQSDLWQPYHHLGRETFLTPVSFDTDGWFTCGDGTCCAEYEISGEFKQERKEVYTFENTDWAKEWVYLRKPDFANYQLEESALTLHGSELTLEDVDSPTFLGIRQLDFVMDLSVDVELTASKDAEALVAGEIAQETAYNAAAPRKMVQGEISERALPTTAGPVTERCDAGITMYMCEREHYDLLLRPSRSGEMPYEAVLRLCIGPVKQERAVVPVSSARATLKVVSEPTLYHFLVIADGKEVALADAETKYLSSEVSSGFTGVVMGLFAEGDVMARFEKLHCVYNKAKN